MTLPNFQIELSTALDGQAAGKLVKFFCLGTGKYEKEKAHDHEEYMRKCDADMIRLLCSIFYKQIKPLVESRKVRSVNAPDALAVVEICTRGLSRDGDNGEQLRNIKPYSPGMLYTCCGYLALVLPELDPAPVADAPHSLTKLYKQLATLAAKAERRYEVIEYAD